MGLSLTGFTLAAAFAAVNFVECPKCDKRMRISGYRVQVVEFVSPDATARNILLRAEQGVKSGQPQPVCEYLDLRDAWGVTPWLETRLSGILSKHLSRYGN